MMRARHRLPAAVAGVLLGLLVTCSVLKLVPVETAVSAAPDRLGGPPLAEDAGPLTELVFHYLPEIEPQLRAPYHDLLGTLPSDTRLIAIVTRDAGAPSVRRFLDTIDPGLNARTRVVTVPGPISPWSKDRALVLEPGEDIPLTTLLTPLPPSATWERRRNDWHTVAAFAARRPQFVVRQLPLEFDAGDFAVTRRGVVVDVNLLAKNRQRQLATPQDLEQRLEPLLGTDVIVLGQREGDVPRHHLSMYMMPLGRHAGRDVVLVGDPRLARQVVGNQFLPGELDPDTKRPLRADFSATMIERHDRAAEALRQAGFTVVRLPSIPFLDKTYMAYTNSVLGTWGERRIAWVPVYDLPELDQQALATYERLGWEVRPVHVRSVYAFHGTIGCLVNVIRRAPIRV